MATRQEMEATYNYNYMDEIFRLSLGETGDITCATYDMDKPGPAPADAARVEGQCPPEPEQSNLERPFTLGSGYISQDTEVLAFGT